MPDMLFAYDDCESDTQVAARLAPSLSHDDYFRVRDSYFKITRKYPIAVPITAVKNPLYNIVKAQAPKKLSAVLGCTQCGKPAGLVGDIAPEDGLCPWCRKAGHPWTPAANKKWYQEVMQASIDRNKPPAGIAEIMSNTPAIIQPRGPFKLASRLESQLESQLDALVDAMLVRPTGEDDLLAWARVKIPHILSKPVVEGLAPVEAVPPTKEPTKAPKGFDPAQVSVQQTWAPKDSRRVSSFTVVDITPTHVIGEDNRKVALNRMHKYRLVDPAPLAAR